MKIERFELRHLTMPLAAPFTTSMGTDSDGEHIIIRIDAEGLTGWGECVAEAMPFYAGETVTSSWYMLKDFLIPPLLGKKLSTVSHALKLIANVRGNRMAKAGLEAALWALFAKARNTSLSRMLGGEKNSVAVGVSIGIYDSTAALLKKIERHLTEGYQTIKLKIARGSDMVPVKAVRKEFPAIQRQVDANC